MRILVLGAGRMGAWLTESLRLNHEVAVYDTDRNKPKELSGAKRMQDLSEVMDFEEMKSLLNKLRYNIG